VNANPYVFIFIGENINIVIAAAHCAQLVSRVAFQFVDKWNVPSFV
jgi:hypothetical protein